MTNSRPTDSLPPTVAPAKLQFRVRCPNLPLAVYREVKAHLRQIQGVEAGLLPQTSQKFGYLQSQVGGLWFRYPAADADRCQHQIELILGYYGQRFRPWETLKSTQDD